MKFDTEQQRVDEVLSEINDLMIEDKATDSAIKDLIIDNLGYEYLYDPRITVHTGQLQHNDPNFSEETEDKDWDIDWDER